MAQGGVYIIKTYFVGLQFILWKFCKFLNTNNQKENIFIRLKVV